MLAKKVGKWLALGCFMVTGCGTWNAPKSDTELFGPKCPGKQFPCDGYAQLHTGDPKGYETEKNTPVSRPKEEGLELVGTFDPEKPTLIWIHGWNLVNKNASFGFPVAWAEAAHTAGYNVFAFHWFQQSFDLGKGCAGLGWFGGVNEPCNASQGIYRLGGAGDFFLESYITSGYFGREYKKEIRFVAHSMGAQLATFVAYRLWRSPEFQEYSPPTRIDFVDPYVKVGLGKSREKPTDGQLPLSLPADYSRMLATDFFPGSKCKSEGPWYSQANYLSQYCQTEGMLWALRRFNVSFLNLTSLVGWASAEDFRKIITTESFSGWAFSGNFEARHRVPPASYWFSLTAPEPKNGWSAASDSEKLKRNIGFRTQSAGYNTVELGDDSFR